MILPGVESYPKLLNIPPKLMPMVTDFGKYKFFVITGGRGSSKTQTAGRVVLKIGDEVNVRIVCGREVQNTIEESVHAVLADIIKTENLAYTIRQKYIKHHETGSEIRFKGFREQGAINVKGLEGVDILWIDEAQTITKKTLDLLIPTLRKEDQATGASSKVIFTMNRFMRDDAVVTELVGRSDCLHIHINYDENPYCPATLIREALLMKQKSEKEYRHIWLGEPRATADEYLFNFDKLHDSLNTNVYGELFYKQRILGIDFAAQGNDLCVATILDRVSNQHWQVVEQIEWGESDTTISVGKIINLIGVFKPTVSILDVGGGGHNVHCDLTSNGRLMVQRFDGGSTAGINTKIYANQRAEGYHILKEWFEQGFLKINEQNITVINELEKIKTKYRSNGSRLIEDKQKMKKEIGASPDHADSLMMAVYGAVKYLGRPANMEANAEIPIKRLSGSKRRR